jgi:hypothetical protein
MIAENPAVTMPTSWPNQVAVPTPRIKMTKITNIRVVVFLVSRQNSEPQQANREATWFSHYWLYLPLERLGLAPSGLTTGGFPMGSHPRRAPKTYL